MVVDAYKERNKLKERNEYMDFRECKAHRERKARNKAYKAHKERAQGTVELAVVMPVVLIVAVMAVNICTFISECASFDRVSRQIIRVNATSPSYGESKQETQARIKDAITQQFNKENESVDVYVAGQQDSCVTYVAKLNYLATLFGMGMRDEIFGVKMPALSHEVKLAVDPYNPSVFVG